MYYRYSKATNIQYITNNQFRDIAVDSAPIVLMGFAKNIDQTETPDKLERTEGTQYYQLVYIAEGEMEFTFNGKKQICGANTFILFKPNEPQIHNVVPNVYTIRYFFNFSGSKAEEMLRRYGINEQVITFPEPFVWCEQIYHDMDTIHKTMFKEDVCNYLFSSLLGIIGGTLRAQYPVNEGGFAELLHIMQTNYTKDISVSDYAKILGYNEKYFIALFKKATGKTPHNYITTQRMDKAKRLLLTTNLSVKQVAARVGYMDSRYFSRLFASFFAQTPSEFKKKMQKK